MKSSTLIEFSTRVTVSILDRGCQMNLFRGRDWWQVSILPKPSLPRKGGCRTPDTTCRPHWGLTCRAFSPGRGQETLKSAAIAGELYWRGREWRPSEERDAVSPARVSTVQGSVPRDCHHIQFRDRLHPICSGGAEEEPPFTVSLSPFLCFPCWNRINIFKGLKQLAFRRRSERRGNLLLITPFFLPPRVMAGAEAGAKLECWGYFESEAPSLVWKDRLGCYLHSVISIQNPFPEDTEGLTLRI